MTLRKGAGAVAPEIGSQRRATALSRRRLRRWLGPYVWLMPALAILVLMLAYPLVQSLYNSFFELSLVTGRSTRFVGLDNYRRLLFEDTNFAAALSNTVVFTAVAVLLEFGLGLGIALLLHRVIRARGLVRTLALVPMMMTPVVVALMWKLMWDGDFGMVNYFLSFIGLRPVLWLADVATALPAVITTEVWQNTSYAVLILLAGLQAIPDDPYESAAIDGANWWQTFWHITLPLLRSAILIVLVIRTLFAFRVFETIFVLTTGGPANATLVLSIYIQRVAFRFFHLGMASALGWVMLIISLAISIAFIAILRTPDED